MNMKKTAVVIAAIVISATLAHANLIDLTPGGFDLTKPWPQVVANFFEQYSFERMQNIAGANIKINGQLKWSTYTVFGDDRFDITLNPTATGADVDWDLTGTGYHLQFVFAESSAYIAHLYAVRGMEEFVGDGFVEIDGAIPFVGITFTGRNTIPDTGSTLAMLSIAIGILGLYRRVQA